MKKDPIGLSKEIGRLEELLVDLDPLTNEYKVISERLDDLVQTHNRKPKRFLEGLDVNSVFAGMISFSSVLVILNHERLHPIATKALGLIPKLPFPRR